jgi:phosphate transport system permease protein
MNRRRLEEQFFKVLMLTSLSIVLIALLTVFGIVVIRGAPALSWEMVTQTPQGGFYLGKEGGILNAIIGTMYLAAGATILSATISLPIALYLYEYAGIHKFASLIRRALDILCGVPSIVYGAFSFTIMLALGARSSLLWGIITVTMLITPLMTCSIDELLKMVPERLREASMALGTTRIEYLLNIVTRQALPGILTAILLSFGRAAGDTAAVMLTAGYTDGIPHSLGDPVATLPLAVFFQLGSPIPEVQQRAYAAGIILLIMVLLISAISRFASMRLTKFVVK